jgi:hypothetical protein
MSGITANSIVTGYVVVEIEGLHGITEVALHYRPLIEAAAQAYANIAQKQFTKPPDKQLADMFELVSASPHSPNRVVFRKKF